MAFVPEIIDRAVQQLLGRASGPLHFRLVIQPTIATILAIRAGLRDARAGEPPFLWTAITDPASRRRLLQSGWKDIGKIFVIAMLLDGVFQFIILRGFHLVQALVVAVLVALLPYVIVRGPVNRIARRSQAHARDAAPASKP